MAQQFVDDAVKNHKVAVFSKTYCPYCVKAKDTFKKYLGQVLPENQYFVVELENRPDGDAVIDYLHKLTGAKTVPRVFINGKCIGGGDDTVALDQQGKLVGLLTA